eukprot:CAMPEP_0201691218 /NCGR_PEP_ID=MMETSP0578-20130828/4436_1 /ASSEMBLY_ACC=CAM_ASM_000663 /TAXON_ID=267565 /ORGANISM="Skeletonema grethea, Strain CCMP 1804" /LENGTH=378 /DNA_ID=CAMNT_0048176379 /DNA_START=75 /DNA_END=1211 /DNA_ORIENTATION=+
MAFHPPPPSFELHTPSEPQWFPRPITDTIESSLDLLERVEEDRRRRLRSIANVSARVPIGLGGTEDRGNAGATSGANVSPKPPSNLSNRPGHYGRYRYYPPPDETPPDESISLHRSYQLEASFSSSLVTGRSPERRKNYSNTNSAGRYRTAAAAAGSSSSSSSVRNRSRSTSHSPHQRRNRDLHTPTDGIGTTTATGAPPTVHMDQDSTSNNSDSGSSIEGGRFLDSFNVSTSAVLFLSPPFDPRAGGGGGVRRHTTPRGGGSRRSSIGSSTSFSSSHLYQQSSSVVDWSMSTPHNAASSQQQQQQQLQVDTAIQPTASSSVDVSAMVDDADLITPPANMTTTTADAASAQHGHGADVYSQRSVRRSQRQRRRRRDWE